jgi:hypothetical protein
MEVSFLLISATHVGVSIPYHLMSPALKETLRVRVPLFINVNASGTAS